MYILCNISKYWKYSRSDNLTRENPHKYKNTRNLKSFRDILTDYHLLKISLQTIVTFKQGFEDIYTVTIT